jgi:hypothetical protein
MFKTWRKMDIKATEIYNLFNSTWMIGLIYGVYRHFQQYFSYIMAVSFIDGGNRSTQRKPPSSRK